MIKCIFVQISQPGVFVPQQTPKELMKRAKFLSHFVLKFEQANFRAIRPAYNQWRLNPNVVPILIHHRHVVQNLINAYIQKNPNAPPNPQRSLSCKMIRGLLNSQTIRRVVNWNVSIATANVLFLLFTIFQNEC